MEKIKTLIAKCYNLIQNEKYQEAIESCKSLLEKQPENFHLHYYLGLAYHNIGEINLAYKSIKKAESLSTKKEDLLHVYSLLGAILHQMDRFEDAFIYYNASLLIAKELNNTEIQASILNNIAGIYRATGQLDDALYCYETSLNLQKDEAKKSITYNNMAIIWEQKGNYKKATEYLYKAIETDEKHKNYTQAAIHKLNLAETYRRAKDLKKAEKYLTEAIKQLKTTNNKYWEAMGYLYLGWLYKDKGIKKDSKEYFTKAYTLFKSIGAKGFMNEAIQGLEALAKLN